ncbi:aspartate aminotransferase [Helicobacter sp. CLO-3]|uniref:pyridoxal phosphate-dependent aminotransferase n=1 Tax=unclassified Helicobacter TaxID=2593540 RepID=UPI0008055423|nr:MULTISPECIES: pyridoxal phosphate-dependent aminotransferase [unclassified Helicobacter]OBV28383.1 aspartate aminotransferase [Helicobacter sp. CLO-3]OHU82032.1 aspartate aminotransferase [Helicobacter sp. CLO-3]
MTPAYSTRIKNLQESATIAIATLASELKAKGQDILSFSAGEPDFDTPQAIKDAAKDALDKGYTKYTPVAGIPELKSAIAAKLQRENALTYAPNQILVSNGAKQSLFNAFAALIDEGDEVIIPSPYWVTYPELVSYHGGKSVFIETSPATDFKITPEQLRQAITPKTKALVLTSPSNPTGMVYTKDELTQIAKILESTNAYIISDEMYEKLIYEGSFTSIASVSEDSYRRTITINGLSKSVAMTGWRMGYLACADTKLVKLMTNLQSQCTSNINSITQHASIVALSGKVDDKIESMRQAFLSRRNLACEKINKIEGISVIPPHGAFYLFIDISKLARKMDSMEFCKQALEKAGLAFVPGLAFGMEGFIRMSFACGEAQISEGLDRLERFIKAL